MDNEPVLGAYLDQIDDAAARSDGSGVRDLIDELDAACRSGSQPSAALHLIVVRRLTKAALVGTLDPVVAAAAAETAICSLLSGLTRFNRKAVLIREAPSTPRQSWARPAGTLPGWRMSA